MVIGSNKFTGELVAIKAIDTKKYTKLAQQNRISEIDAMRMCKESHGVVKILDSFELDGQTYIVTKYAKGGDLLEYCLEQPDQSQWMTEKRARHIFQ